MEESRSDPSMWKVWCIYSIWCIYEHFWCPGSKWCNTYGWFLGMIWNLLTWLTLLNWIHWEQEASKALLPEGNGVQYRVNLKYNNFGGIWIHILWMALFCNLEFNALSIAPQSLPSCPSGPCDGFSSVRLHIQHSEVAHSAGRKDRFSSLLTIEAWFKMMRHFCPTNLESKAIRGEAPLGFKPRISCLPDSHFNQLSHSTYLYVLLLEGRPRGSKYPEKSKIMEQSLDSLKEFVDTAG